ncbi:response regulator [Nafulsella turpanensis]|uniref:response regulator n=1 Tax=Nafulsella turpanensis TaxID=1265690 RepID=UPI0003465357|nr:response regulator [Nafulsella turpanensis]
MRILIVEDDELTLQLYDILLEDQQGIEWTKAGNGSEAMAYLNQCKNEEWPDVVLVDLDMPDMSGFELIEKMEEKYGKKLLSGKIYILTNSISKRDEEKADKHPLVQGLLSKPLGEESLQRITTSIV